MKNIIIVTGGTIREEFIKEVMSACCEQPFVIGVDKGLEILDSNNIKPDLIIGDFDSAKESIKLKYINAPGAIILNPEKDFTDTHVAVVEALKMKPQSITIIGATGTRIDHLMGNISLLKLCLEKGVEAVILDEHNKIRMIDRRLVISKEKQYGKYISCIPFSDEVSGIYLSGFKYGLSNATITKDETIGISNELREEEGHIIVGKGYLLIMETKD